MASHFDVDVCCGIRHEAMGVGSIGYRIEAPGLGQHGIVGNDLGFLLAVRALDALGKVSGNTQRIPAGALDDVVLPLIGQADCPRLQSIEIRISHTLSRDPRFDGVTDAVLLRVLEGPVGQIADPGTTAQFDVTTTGTPPFCYRCRRNDVDSPPVDDAILRFTNVTVPDGGGYTTVVSNHDGGPIVSSGAELRVGWLPRLVAGPRTRTRTATSGAGIGLSLGAQVERGEPLHSQSYRDGVALPGVSGSIYVQPIAAVGDGGQHTVQVWNDWGEIVVGPSEIHVLVPSVVVAETPLHLGHLRLRDETLALGHQAVANWTYTRESSLHLLNWSVDLAPSNDFGEIEVAIPIPATAGQGCCRFRAAPRGP
jgi:hypothetical protein